MHLKSASLVKLELRWSFHRKTVISFVQFFKINPLKILNSLKVLRWLTILPSTLKNTGRTHRIASSRERIGAKMGQLYLPGSIP